MEVIVNEVEVAVGGVNGMLPKERGSGYTRRVCW